MSSAVHHECGHAVLGLAFGGRVRELQAGAYGGYCLHDPVRDPAGQILILLGGAVADRITGAKDFGQPSDGDLDLLAAAIREWECASGRFWSPKVRERFEDQAARKLFELRDPFDFLAAQLAERGFLGERRFGELVHAPGSPLQRFNWLYPRPVTPSPLSPRATAHGASAEAEFRAAMDAEFGPVRRSRTPESLSPSRPPPRGQSYPPIRAGATDAARAEWRRGLRRHCGIKF